MELVRELRNLVSVAARRVDISRATVRIYRRPLKIGSQGSGPLTQAVRTDHGPPVPDGEDDGALPSRSRRCASKLSNIACCPLLSVARIRSSTTAR